jgi:siroheme synthase (precorrin-2 oxidase/ferrochelatase)
MLVDLILDGRHALVVGDGIEPEFKTVKLLDSRAIVTVIGENFTPGLQRMAFRKHGRVRLVSARPTVKTVLEKVEEIEPVVVFISTGDPELDEELSGAIRKRTERMREGARGGEAPHRPGRDGAPASASPLICAVDEPWLNDFNMPAIAKRGDIRVGVSTGGKSPAMAGTLRRRIEEIITEEDVLQVRLQGYIRRASRKWLRDAASRKELVYKIIHDEKIGRLLRKEKYEAAKERAERLLSEQAANQGPRPPPPPSSSPPGQTKKEKEKRTRSPANG